MKRPARVALNVLMPPLLATCGFLAITIILVAGECLSGGPSAQTRNTLRDLGATTLLIAFFAYIIAGIPSILHAIFMEFAYLKYPADLWPAVYISTLSGTLAGLLIAGFIGKGQLSETAVFIVVGFLVGLCLGMIVKWLSRSKPDHPPSSMRGCE